MNGLFSGFFSTLHQKMRTVPAQRSSKPSISTCAAGDFRIGDYPALALFGEAKMLPDTEYISFTGDYGFFRRVPKKQAIENHIAQESSFLANFHLKVINLEYMLSGSSGKKRLRQIDDVSLDMLKRSGYDVISRANNHAMQFGREGVRYNTHILEETGFTMIGTRDFPVYNWETGGLKIAVFSLTDYTDKPDPEGLILKINESDLQSIKNVVSSADFCIAFAHLGSMSFYPSPHERQQVARIIKSGADLVVCTGNHYIKGFVYEKGTPVAYGIGNHMFSWAEKDTEPIGMHFVAGFKHRELVQLLAVPFHNTIMKGTSGPLDEAAFASFKNILADRSTSDSSRYYSDPRSVAGFRERLRRLTLSKLKTLRARHFVYAGGILFHNHRLMRTATGFLSIIAGVVTPRLAVFRRRAGKRYHG